MKRSAILTGAVVVVGVAVTVGSVSRAHAKRDDAKRMAELEGEWGTLQGCLLGAPLVEKETPASRFRAIQLGVLGIPRAARSPAHEGAWPARCAGYAEKVASNADASRVNVIEIRESAASLAKELRADEDGMADLGKLVEQLWKTVGAAKMSVKPGNSASAPKPVAPLLGDGAFAGAGSFSGDFALSNVKLDPAPSANLRFVVDDRNLKGGSLVCAASGVPVTLSCERVSTDVATSSPGLSLFGTTDVNARPWVFAGDRGQLGIYRPSGTLALKGPALGASVGVDDSAWILVHQPGGGPNDLGLIHAPLTGDLPPALPALNGSEIASPGDATLLWSWLVDWTGPNARLPHHLVAHMLGANGEVGPAMDIGVATDLSPAELTDTEPRFTACRTKDHVTVRVHGAHADAVAFFTGVAWTTPVALATHGGALVCEENEAVVTRITGVDGAQAIEQSRCNAAGCKASRVEMKDLFDGTDVVPHGAGSFAATELNGQLLLVWNAGPVGGLRMRLATMDRLKATPDMVIADTAKESGTAGTVTELRLVSAAEDALLFVKTMGGVHLLSVDKAAKLVALGAGI